MRCDKGLEQSFCTREINLSCQGSGVRYRLCSCIGEASLARLLWGPKEHSALSPSEEWAVKERGKGPKGPAVDKLPQAREGRGLEAGLSHSTAYRANE